MDRKTGYVKLYRQMLDSDISQQNDSVFAAFVKILLMVPKSSGILTTDISNLTRILHFGSRNTTYKVLGAMETCGSIKKEAGKNLKITVLNWGKFQQKKGFQSVQNLNADCSKSEQALKIECSKNEHGCSKSEHCCSKNEHDNIRNANIKNINKNINKNNNIYSDAQTSLLQNAQNNFLIFWNKYPKNSGKKECLIWWQKNYKNLDFKKVMAGLDWYVKSDRVRKGFCLDPIRFLKREIWADDPKAYQDHNFTGSNLPSPQGKYKV